MILLSPKQLNLRLLRLQKANRFPQLDPEMLSIFDLVGNERKVARATMRWDLDVIDRVFSHPAHLHRKVRCLTSL